MDGLTWHYVAMYFILGSMTKKKKKIHDSLHTSLKVSGLMCQQQIVECGPTQAHFSFLLLFLLEDINEAP